MAITAEKKRVETPAGNSDRWAAIGISVTAASLMLFIVLQHLTPTTFLTHWGKLNYLGVKDYQTALLGHTVPQMSNSSFAFCLGTLLITAWIGYGILLVAGVRGAAFRARSVVAPVAGMATIMAIFCPPSLSVDAYGYLGHAHLQVVHGLNPYFHKTGELKTLGSPVAQYLRWDVLCPYGPFWIIICCGIVGLLQTVGIWWQLVAVKLTVAISLVVAAVAGRKIAEHFLPGRGNLTLLAIGLNPLFLIEGPANGHCDMVMMSLLMVGAVFYLKKRYALAAVFMGFSAAAKLITAAVFAWFSAERVWLRPSRASLIVALAVVGLAILPLVITYSPFWNGPATLAGVTTLPTLSTETTGQPPSNGGGLMLSSFLDRQWSLAAVYIILSLWLLNCRKAGQWLTAWIGVSGFMAVFAMGEQFPWYLTWPWTVALTRWTRPHIFLSWALFALSFALTIKYAVPI